MDIPISLFISGWLLIGLLSTFIFMMIDYLTCYSFEITGRDLIFIAIMTLFGPGTTFVLFFTFLLFLYEMISDSRYVKAFKRKKFLVINKK